MHSAGGNRRSCGSVSRFGHPRINARLPASRGLSQAAASFVASRCQDIHRTPLRAWPRLPIAVHLWATRPHPPGKHAGGAESSGPARAWQGRTMLPTHTRPGLRPPRGEPRSRAEWAGRPVMGQLSPKKVLDDARPTESTVLEHRAVGTDRCPPGWGSPRMQGRASRIRPTPPARARAAPSLGDPTGRRGWPSSLNLVFTCQRASSTRLRLIGVASQNNRLGD